VRAVVGVGEQDQFGVEAKTQPVHLRVATSDDELFRSAAAASNESLSEFLVESGRERAERILADRTKFVLTASQ